MESQDVLTRRRVLMIHPGPVPPSEVPASNAHYFLSAHLTGDILTTTWARTAQAHNEVARRTTASRGAFGYYAARLAHLSPFWRFVTTFCYFTYSGLRLSRRSRYDAIIAYGPFTTALAGYVIARLCNTALVVDMPGHPFNAFRYQPGTLARIKLRVARKLVPAVLRRADGIKLLYPTQLEDITLRKKHVLTSSFHDFTAISGIRPGNRAKYILLLGHPFALKGVSTAIRAFLEIAGTFPEHQLLIVGHCPDLSPFKLLAQDHPRIEFHGGVPHPTALELIENCSILILPSFTEGMPRVIIEAFAARRPVVATSVGGIPFLVRDGIDGLLVPAGNSQALAKAMSTILLNPELAGKLAASAHNRARTMLTEERFAHAYASFIEQVVRSKRKDSGSG